MRNASARTAAVTLACLAVVVGVGFAVQAAILGRAEKNPTLVARTVAGLLHFHVSRATMIVNGKHLSTVCTERWHGAEPIATVVVAGGPKLVEIGNHLVTTSKLAVDEFELAGCPRPLRKWLATQLNRGATLDIAPTRQDGKPVLGVGIPGSELGLKLFVTRSGLFPVALSIHGGGVWGASELSYGAAPALATPRPARSGKP